MASPTINIWHRWYIVTMDEPTWIYHYHSKSVVYIRAHSVGLDECVVTYGLPWWLRRQRIHLQFFTIEPGINPWVGKIPWKGYPLQYFYLENSMDRGVWWATVYRVMHLLHRRQILYH